MKATAKWCPKCHTKKPADSFGRNRRRADGLQGWCKDCFRGYHQINAERERAQMRANYRANRTQRIIAAREWVLANPGRRRRNLAAWNERNIERVREYARAGADRRRAQGGPITPEAREYRKLLLGDVCSYCGDEGAEVDHIVPLAGGGTNDWMNFTAACRSCNAAKGTKSLLTHLLDAAEQ